MAHTKSGILILTKAERKALEIIKEHTKTDLSFREGGTYTKAGGRIDWDFDKVGAKNAELGIELIDFILKITA